jgi:hypothetical protein
MHKWLVRLVQRPAGILVVPGAIIGVLILGRFFAHPENAVGPADCVWSLSGCSTAAATWLLFILAVAALLPAVLSYRLEAEPIIFLSPCTCRDRKVVGDLYVTVESDDTGLVAQEVTMEPNDYEKDFVEFTNLGRSPALGVTVHIRFTKDTAQTEPMQLRFGPLPKDYPRHLAICMNPQVTPVTIRIEPNATVRSSHGEASIKLEAQTFEWIVGNYRPPAQEQLPGL